MPKDTMMTGKYHAKMVHVSAGIITTTASGLGMKVKVTDPEGKLIMDRMYGHKGTDFRKYQIVLSSRLTRIERSIHTLMGPRSGPSWTVWTV